MSGIITITIAIAAHYLLLLLIRINTIAFIVGIIFIMLFSDVGFIMFHACVLVLLMVYSCVRISLAASEQHVSCSIIMFSAASETPARELLGGLAKFPLIVAHTGVCEKNTPPDKRTCGNIRLKKEIRGWRAVSVAGLQGEASHKRIVAYRHRYLLGPPNDPSSDNPVVWPWLWGRLRATGPIIVNASWIRLLNSKPLYCLHFSICASSLRRGHANLLCIVPMLTDDPRRESHSKHLYVWMFHPVHTIVFCSYPKRDSGSSTSLSL